MACYGGCGVAWRCNTHVTFNSVDLLCFLIRTWPSGQISNTFARSQCLRSLAASQVAATAAHHGKLIPALKTNVHIYPPGHQSCVPWTWPESSRIVVRQRRRRLESSRSSDEETHGRACACGQFPGFFVHRHIEALVCLLLFFQLTTSSTYHGVLCHSFFAPLLSKGPRLLAEPEQHLGPDSPFVWRHQRRGQIRGRVVNCSLAI